jgi:Ca2+-binding EF-hand superfamily protein
MPAGLNPLFTALDGNGDGMITPQEIRRAAVSLKKLDADGDGNISLAEASPQMGDPAQMANQMFAQADRDGDGQLTAAELPPQMGRMIQAADQDGNGAISREEFNASMERMRGQFGMPFGGARGGGMNDPRTMLQQYDRDGNGRLTANEVPPQLGTMLQGMDQNRDGAIDAAELQGAAAQWGQRTGRGMGERGFDPGPFDADRGGRRGPPDRNRP